MKRVLVGLLLVLLVSHFVMATLPGTVLTVVHPDKLEVKIISKQVVSMISNDSNTSNMYAELIPIALNMTNESLQKLTYTNYNIKDDTVSFYYKFKNIEKTDLNGIPVIITPEIKFNTKIMYGFYNEYNVSGSIFKPYIMIMGNTNKSIDVSKAYVSKIIPHIVFIDSTYFSKKVVLIHITKTGYVYISTYDKNIQVYTNDKVESIGNKTINNITVLTYKLDDMKNSEMVIYSNDLKTMYIRFPVCFNYEKTTATLTYSNSQCDDNFNEEHIISNGLIINGDDFLKKTKNSSSLFDYHTTTGKIILSSIGIVILLLIILVLKGRSEEEDEE